MTSQLDHAFADAPIDAERWPDVARMPQGIRPSVSQPVASWIFHRAVARMPIRVELPSGRLLGAGASDPEAPTMRVHHLDRMLRRVGSSGLIGFGESYCAAEWDSDDLPGVIAAFADIIDELVPGWLATLRGAWLARQPRRNRPTTAANSRTNVERHYDLSNEMFALFLDPSMSYSAALFDATTDSAGFAGQDLEQSQHRKIDRILDQAGVHSGSSVLEIGSGWGELAIRAAARGAQVHTVTLSVEQLELARHRVELAGLTDQVEVGLTDYREVTGQYDAVVSVEMIEAVGLDSLDTYFGCVHDRLRPGGRATIQAITMPDHRLRATRDGYTWIHKYVFPGGALGSKELLLETAAGAHLACVDSLAMGSSYAETLHRWGQTFDAATAELQELGFDETFRRMWHFYLGYSEGGFRSGYLDVHQLTFSRARA